MTNFIFDLQRFENENGGDQDNNTTKFYLEKVSTDSETNVTTWKLSTTAPTGNDVVKVEADTLTALFADPGVAAGDIIKVEENITDTSTTGTTIDKDLTLEIASSKTWTSSSTEYALNVSGRTLTITGSGSITGSAVTSGLVNLSGGNLVLAGATLTQGNSTNPPPVIDITSSASTFTRTSGSILNGATNNTLYIKNVAGGHVSDGSTTDGTTYSSIAGNNSTLHGINIDGGMHYYLSSATSLSASTVGAVASITADSTTMYYTSLQAAVNAATNGQTIKLENAISQTGYVGVNGKTLTIDLNGHNFTRTDTNNGGILAQNGANLTLTNTSSTAATVSANSLTLYAVGGSTLKLDDSKDNITITTSNSSSSSIAVYASGASTVELVNGKITGTATQTQGINASGASNVTVDGTDISKVAFGVVASGDAVVNVKNSASIEANSYGIYNSCAHTTVADSTILAQNGVYIIGNGTAGSASLSITDSSTNNSKTSITGTNAAILNNGTHNSTSSLGGTDITISGGKIIGTASTTINSTTVTGDGTGIYLPGVNSTTTITGGSITSNDVGIEIRAGSLDISGNTSITNTYATEKTTSDSMTDSLASGTSYGSTGNGSGSTSVGTAIAVSQHNTNMPLSVNISGGTFEAAVALSIVDKRSDSAKSATNVPTPTVAISGGTFTGNKEVTITESNSTTSIGTQSVNNTDKRVTVDITGGTFEGIFNSGLENIVTSGSTNTGTKIETTNGGSYAIKSGATITITQAQYDSTKQALGKGIAVGSFQPNATQYSYTISGPVAMYDGTGYTSLEAAVTEMANATSSGSEPKNTTITLLQDIELDSAYAVTNSFILDLNGHTIKANGSTAFNVATENVEFTLTDAVGTGSVTRAKGGDTALITVSKGTFNMAGGELSGSMYRLIEASGGTVNITGNNTKLTFDNTSSTSGDTNAITVSGNANLNIGGEGNPTIKVTAVRDSSNIITSAISSSGSGAINVYGGTIDVANSANIVKAINMTGTSGSVNVYGGTIKADGLDDDTNDVAINATNNGVTVSITGGNIWSEDYGVYTGGTISIAGSSTSITGDNGGAVLASGTASFGAGVVYNGTATDVNSYFTKGTDNVYTFSKATLTDAGDAIDTTWAYNFGQTVSGDYLGAQQTISFLGDLFNADGLGSIGVAVDSDKNVTLSNDGGFNLTDGASIGINTDGFKLFNGAGFYTLETGASVTATVNTMGGLVFAGDYNSVVSFTSLSSDANTSLWSYKAAGADNDGFVSVTSGLVYHTVRPDEFTIQSNILFNEENKDSLASYFSIDGKTITIDKPDSLFASSSSQTTGAGLWLVNSDAAYSLSMDENYLADDITSIASFDNATLTSVSETATTNTAVYRYVFEGGAVKDGNPMEGGGYQVEEAGKKITYYSAADTLAFLHGDSANIFFNVPDGSIPSGWFTVDKDNQAFTIASAALASTGQYDGATLGFYNAPTDWKLAFADDVVTVGNTYTSVNSFVANDGSSGYIYTSEGLATAGFRIGEYGNDNATLLTYEDASQQISLVGTAVIQDSLFGAGAGSASVDNLANNFGFDKTASIFTIQYASIFSAANFEQGQTIGIGNGGYSLAFGDNFTLLANGTHDSQTYDTSNRVFTGIGASVAGFNGTMAAAGSALTYYGEYDQFTLAANEDSLALTSDFANGVSIKDSVISISDAAFAGVTFVNGHSIQLDTVSAQKYTLSDNDLDDTLKAQYRDAEWVSKSNTWRSAGGTNDGLVLETLGTSKHADALTYYEQYKQVKFAVSAGDTIGFGVDTAVANGIHLGDNSVLAIDASVFSATAPQGDGAVTFSLDSSAAGYTISLGGGYTGNYSLASGASQKAETFDGKAYFGQGAEGAGYALDSDSLGITYYETANRFTLGGSASLNAFTSGDITDFFNVDANGITINSGAINTVGTYAQGKTISIEAAVGADKRLVLGEGLIAAKDFSGDVRLSNTGYKGIGASVAGFAGSGTETLTYYGKYDHFSLASSGANTIGFTTTQPSQDDIPTWITVSGGNVVISNTSILSGVSQGASIAIADGFKDKYTLSFADNLTIAETDINTVGLAQEGSDTTNYVYSFEGADKAGFVSSLGGFQYYQESDKFTISSDLAFNLASVNSGAAFTVDGANRMVTIGAAAFDTTVLDALKDGANLQISADNHSSQYSLYLQTLDASGYENFRTTAMYAADTYTANTSRTEDNATLIGTYNFAGAYNNGFETVTSGKATSYTYREKADEFKLAGTVTLNADTFKNGSANPAYVSVSTVTSAVSFLSTGAFESLATGQKIYIVNPDDSIQTTQYQLVLGDNLSSVTNNLDHDTLTVSKDNTSLYSFQGAGADNSGFTADNGTLTYFAERTFDFSLYSDATLNTTLTPSDSDISGTYGNILSVSGTKSAGYNITIGSGAFVSGKAALAQGDVISLASGTGTLALDSSYYTLSANQVQDSATVSSQTYTGIGAVSLASGETGGFYGGGTSFTYYKEADKFTLGDGLAFNTTLTSESLNSAISVVDKVITVNDLGLFNADSLETGDILTLSSASASSHTLGVASNLTLSGSDISTVGLDTVSGTSYVYTFEGAKEKAGFISTVGGFKFYDVSDKLDIESGIAFNIDSIKSNDALFSVDKDGNKITIAADALNFSNLTGGEKITAGSVNGAAYTLIRGAGMNETTSYGANFNEGVFKEAGQTVNAFAGYGTSELTYFAPARQITLASSNNLEYVETGAQTKITIDGTGVGAAVSIDRSIVQSANDGASLGLAKGSGALGYTIDFVGFQDDGNVYYDTASLTTGEGTASYTSTGMSSVAGFNVTGNNSSLAVATWYNKASVVGFNTEGGITFSDAGASYISLGGGKVTIGKNALANETWFSTAKLSLDAASASNYDLVLGSDVTNKAAGYSDATFNNNTKAFNEAGATTAGYSITGGGDILTYYANPRTVLFEGTNIDFTTDAAKNIILDGSTVLVGEAAVNLTGLEGTGSNKIVVSTAGYTLSLENLTTAEDVQSSNVFDYSSLTYKSTGASVAGFNLSDDSRTATYWKQYNTFTFDSGSSLLSSSATANNFTLSSDSVISVAEDVINTTTGGAFLGLDATSANNGYKLTWTKDTMSAADATADANLNKETGVYHAKGATQDGFVLSGDTLLTYYKEAENFQFLLVKDGVESTLTSWNSTMSGAEIASDFNIDNGTVEIQERDVDTSSFVGDGTEVFSIKSSGDITYKMVNTGGWQVVTKDNIISGDLSAEGLLRGAGAVFSDRTQTQGLYDNNGSLTYYRKAAEVTLGGSAQFTAVDASISSYFTIADSVVTFQEKALDAIANEAEGVSITANNGAYTINIDAVKAGGDFNSTAKFASKEYTGVGLTGSEAAAGFLADTNSTVATYHEVADTVSFDGSSVTFNDSAVPNNITISAADDNSVKTITLSQAAFTAADGNVVSIATDKYVFNTTLNDDKTSIGGLSYAGEYNADNIFGSVASGAWTYKGAGADYNGFIAGEGADSQTALTYHTARTDEFSLTGNVLFNDTLTATTAANYFSISNTPTDAKYSVTVTSDIFAKEGQTNGATVVASGSNKDYKLFLSDAVTMLTAAAFNASTGSYVSEGASDNGFTVDDNGVLTYRTKGESFSFKNGDGFVKFNTDSTLSDSEKAKQWFTVTPDANKNFVVVVTKEALSTSQTEGAILALDDASTVNGYRFDTSNSTNLYSSDNTYSASASFTANSDGGYTYTSKGMSSENGYVLGDEEGTLIYHDKATNLTFTGTIKFNELTADTIDSLINVDNVGHFVTINSGAFNEIQSTGAYISVAENDTVYTIVYGGTNSLGANDTSAAAFKDNVFTSAGSKKQAGYLGSNSTLLTFYDTPQEITFTGNATFNEAKAADNITITKGDTGSTVTVGFDALTSPASFINGRTLRISNSDYYLAVDDSLDGGTYDSVTAFARKGQTGTDDAGNPIYSYTYKYSGADKNGYVRTNDTTLTFRNKSGTDPIEFEGNLNFKESVTSSELANHFIVDDLNKKVWISNTVGVASIFEDNYDNYYLALSGTSSQTYDLAIDDTFTPTVGGNEYDSVSFTKDGNAYTYRTTGADNPGYKISDDANSLIYRAAYESVVFNGDVSLDTANQDYMTVSGGVVTLGESVLGASQEDGATLAISSYTVSDGSKTYSTPTLQIADGITEWQTVGASLADYKRKYTTAGYSEGYKVEDGTLSYHDKTYDVITFSGLGSGATTENVTLNNSTNTFVLTKDALNGNSAMVTASENGKTYTLALSDGTQQVDHLTKKDGEAVAATLSSDKKTYTSYKSEAYYTADGTSVIAYTAAQGGSVIGFSGLSTNAAADANVLFDSVAGSFTLTSGAVDKNGVSVDTGYTLILNSDDYQIGAPDAVTSEAFSSVGADHTAAYTYTSVTGEYWTANGTNAYDYTEQATVDAEQFILSGVDTVNGNMVSGKSVTVAYSDVNTGASAVSLSAGKDVYELGYTLTLTGVDSMSHDTVSAEFGSITDNAATYTQTTLTSEYWTKSDSLEAYNKTGADTLTADLFSLSGITTVYSGMVEGNAVSVAYSDVATNAAVVSLSTLSGDAYTLTLTGVDSMPTTTESFAFGDVTNNTATYTSSLHSTEYWTKATDAESYTRTEETVISADLFNISGITTVYSGMVSGNAVNVAYSDVATNAAVVSLSTLSGDAYTLTLTGVDSMPTTTESFAFGDVTNNTATYSSSLHSSEYWTKATDAESYSRTEETVTSAELFSLSGIATVYSGMVSGNAVTVGKDDVASGATVVSMSKGQDVETLGYTLTLTGVDSVSHDTVRAEFGDITDNTATYKQSTLSSDYWTKSETEQSYTHHEETISATAELFSLNGVASVYSGMVNGQAVSVAYSDLASGVSAVSLSTLSGATDAYTLTLTGVDSAPATSESFAFGDVTNNTATYTSSLYSGEYWTKASDAEAYNKTDATVTTANQFTLTGINTVYSGMVSGQAVTVTGDDLASGVSSLTLTQGQGDTYSLTLTGVETEAKATATVGAFGGVADNEAIYQQTATIGAYWTKADSGEAYNQIGETVSSSNLFTLSGVSAVDDSIVSGSTVTIGLANMVDSITPVSLTGDNYTLALGSGLDAAETVSAKKFDAETGTYTTAGVGTGYTVGNSGKTISYIGEDEATSKVFVLTGLASTASKAKNSFNVDEENKKLEIGSLAVPTDGSTVTLVQAPEGYTLALGSTIADQASETVNAKKFDAETGTYTTAGTGEGYVLSNNDMSISYITEAQATSKVFQFTGLADTASKAKNSFNVDEDNKKIEIGYLAAPTDGSTATLVKAPEGYSLALGSSIADQASETVSAKKFDAETGTYTTAGTGEGFVLGENDMSISYITEAQATSKVFRFTGLASTASKAKNSFNIDEENKKVEIGSLAAPTDGSTATLVQAPEGYSLALGSTIADKASETISAKKYDSKTQTYTTAGTGEGFVLSDNDMSISYITEAEATSKVFRFEGLKSTASKAKNSFNVDEENKKIEIGSLAAPTDGSTATLVQGPEGYTLALGSSIADKASETIANTYDEENSTYRTAGTTEGYALGDDSLSVSYVTEDKATSQQFVFSNVADTAVTRSFSASDGEIRVATTAIKTDGTALKLESAPDGYKLAMGSSVKKRAATTGGTLSDDVYTYGTTAGYVLNSDENSIYYNAEADNKLKLSGVASKIKDPSNGIVTLKAANFSTEITVEENTDNYSFIIGTGTYTGKTFTGSSSADTVTVSGTNVSVNGGAGNDIVTVNGKGGTVVGGNGADTLIGGSNADNLLGGAGADSLSGGAGADTLSGGGSADILDGGAGNDSLDGGAGNDSLSGGAGKDTLLGGAGNDTLWGGAGNDALYGGNGKDTFVYRPNEGTDTIYDFDSADMLQIVNSSGKQVGYTSATFASSRLTLSIDGGGTVVLRDMSNGDKVNINGTTRTISGGTLK